MASQVSLMFVRADNENKTTRVDALLSDPMRYVVARAAKSLGITRGEVGLTALNGGPIPFREKTVGDIVERFGTNFKIATSDWLGQA